jgi:hypothetical protein
VSEGLFSGMSVGDWLRLGAVAVGAAVVGGVLVAQSRRAGAPRLVHGDLASRALFEVLTRGVLDGDLRRNARPGGPELLALKKSFSDAKLLGISPTDLASSGRYFGAEVEPLRIDVHADGTLHLHDADVNRYEAAKFSGAFAALADVVQRDFAGEPVAERRAVVRLL